MTNYNQQNLYDNYEKFKKLDPALIEQRRNQPYDVKGVFERLRNEGGYNERLAKEIIANDLLFLQGFTPKDIESKVYGGDQPLSSEDIIEQSTAIRKRTADDKFLGVIDKERFVRGLFEGAGVYQGIKRGFRTGLAAGSFIPAATPLTLALKGILAAGGAVAGGITGAVLTKGAQEIIAPEDLYMPGADQSAANAADTLSAIIAFTPGVKALASKIATKEGLDASISSGVTALRNAINPGRESIIRKAGEASPELFKRLNQAAGKSKLLDKTYTGGRATKNFITGVLGATGKAAREGAKDIAIPKAVPLVGGRAVPAKFTGPPGLKLGDPFVRAEIGVGAAAVPGTYFAEKTNPGELLPRIAFETISSIINIPRITVNLGMGVANKIIRGVQGQKGVDKRTGEFIAKKIAEAAEQGEDVNLTQIMAQVQEAIDNGQVISPGQVTLAEPLIQIQRELVSRLEKNGVSPLDEEIKKSIINQVTSIQKVINTLRTGADAGGVTKQESENLINAAADIEQNRLKQIFQVELRNAMDEVDKYILSIKGPKGKEIDDALDADGYSSVLDEEIAKKTREALDRVLTITKDKETELWTKIDKGTPVETSNILARWKEITDPNSEGDFLLPFSGNLDDLKTTDPELGTLITLLNKIYSDAGKEGAKSTFNEVRRIDNRIESLRYQINKQLNESDIYRDFEKTTTDPNKLSASDRGRYNKALEKDPDLTIEEFFMMENQPLGFLMNPIKLAKNPVLTKPRLKKFIEEIEKLGPGEFEGTKIGKGKYANYSSAELGRLKKIAQDTLELTQLNENRINVLSKYPKDVINLGYLKNMRTLFREKSKELINRGKNRDAAIYSTIGESILADMEDALIPKISIGTGKSQLDLFRDARNFSKSRNDVFGSTYMTQLFERNASGRIKYDPELLLERTLSGTALASRIKYNEIINAFEFLKRDPFDSNPLKVMKDGRAFNVDREIKDFNTGIEYIFRGIAQNFIKEKSLRQKFIDFDNPEQLTLDVIDDQSIRNFVEKYKEFFDQPPFVELKNLLLKGGESSKRFMNEIVPSIVKKNKEKEELAKTLKTAGFERPSDVVNNVLFEGTKNPTIEFTNLSKIIAGAKNELPGAGDTFTGIIVEELLERVLREARLPGNPNAGKMLDFVLNSNVANLKNLKTTFKEDFKPSENSVLNLLKKQGLLNPETETLIKEQIKNLDKVASYFKELDPKYLDLSPSTTDEKIARVVGLQAIGSLTNYLNLFKGVGSIQAGGIASDVGKEILADAPMFLLKEKLVEVFTPGKGEEFIKIMKPFENVKFSKEDLKTKTIDSATAAMQEFENALLKYFGLPLSAVPATTFIREGITAPVTDTIVPTGRSQEEEKIKLRKELFERNKKLKEMAPRPGIKPLAPANNIPPSAANLSSQTNLGPFNPDTLARMEQLDKLIG